MNSFDDMLIDKNALNDFVSLKTRIDEMNNWIDHLDDEIISYRRRLYIDYEKIFNIANIMEKIMTEFGDKRVQGIIDDYMENERQDGLKKQRQMAKNAECNFEFVDLDTLFSTEK